MCFSERFLEADFTCLCLSCWKENLPRFTASPYASELPSDPCAHVSPLSAPRAEPPHQAVLLPWTHHVRAGGEDPWLTGGGARAREQVAWIPLALGFLSLEEKDPRRLMVTESI